MGKLVRKLFGGTDKELRRTIRENTEQARTNALQLFPSGEANRNLANEQVLELLGGAIPQQFSTFRSGNVEAQRAAQQGLSMANNAILGNPLGDFLPPPVSIEVDPGFSNQDLPEFTNIADSLLERDAGTSALLAGINTDADLLRAASEGKIGDFGSKSRKWFDRFLNSDSARLANSTSLIDDPIGSISQLMSTKDPQFKGVKREELPGGVFTPKNIRRLSTLLNQYKGL